MPKPTQETNNTHKPMKKIQPFVAYTNQHTNHVILRPQRDGDGDLDHSCPPDPYGTGEWVAVLDGEDGGEAG